MRFWAVAGDIKKSVRIEFHIFNDVMPAQAGTRFFRNTPCDSLDSRLRGNDKNDSFPVQIRKLLRG